MEPQRLVDALALTCRPRSGRDALVLALQACVLRALGDRGVEIEEDGGASATTTSSLLLAFHPIPSAADTYPTQRYRLPNSILLLLKPVALDISIPSSSDDDATSPEPALVLYGRAVGGGGSQEDAVHRLALRVGEFLAAADLSEASLVSGVDVEGREVVRIQGAVGEGVGAGAWWCRLGALGDRLMVHLLAKLLPPSFFPHQLPTLLAALPPPPPSTITPSVSDTTSSGSYNSPFPHLLAFLPAPHAVLALAATCRDCRALGRDAGAWTALLDRDFPTWRDPKPKGSNSSSSSTMAAAAFPTPSSSSSSSPLATYRRLYIEKRLKEGGGGGRSSRRGLLYRPFDGQGNEGWRHFFVPYDPLRHRRPLPMTPGGILLPPYFDRDPEYFEGGSGLGWPRRPLSRYLPFFAPPVGGPVPPRFPGWEDWAWT